MEIKNAQKLKISGTTQGGFQHRQNLRF